MKAAITKRQIISFLSSLNTDTSFVNKLKIRFRAVICPLEKVLEYIQPGDKVFDIGCGSGQMCLLAAKFTKAVSFSGIEIDEKLVHNAQNLFRQYAPEKSFYFEKYDGVHFPKTLADNNVVLLIDVLHHVPADKQNTFIKNIYESMSPGSRLIFKDMNGASPMIFVNKLHDMVFAGEIGNEISGKTATDMIMKAGFKIHSVQYIREIVYPHYLIIAEK